MPASIRFLAINTVDPDQITPFCALLGVEVESTVGDGQLVLFSRTRKGLTVRQRDTQRREDQRARVNRVSRNAVSSAELPVNDLEHVAACPATRPALNSA
jgi:hypothetical protein